MNYLSKDLGVLSQGSIVEVTLRGTEANVFLVDDLNHARYRRGQSYQYHGGHVTRSPARIGVPATRRWHAVIDLGGGAGRVQAAVRVIAA